MVPVMRSVTGPGLLPALLPCVLRIRPPGCAERPALPVFPAVSGRAVANDIFGGCGTGVKPWRDRSVQAAGLTPLVHGRGAAHTSRPPPSPDHGGARPWRVAELC